MKSKRKLFGLLTTQNSIFIVLLFFFCLYNLQACINHYYFRTNALDYGFHLQAFWHFFNFRTVPLTIFHTSLESYFQVHPSFTLAIITPIGWLLKPIFGSYTLLIIQNIFLTIGAWFTYKTLLLKSKNELISLLACIHYFVLWGHFSAIAFEYIDATIASAMVPAFLYYYFKEKYWTAFIIMLFVVSSRENMPIWFIFIGLFLLVSNFKNKKKRAWAIGITSVSIIYIILLFSLIIPSFHSDGYEYNRFQYSSLGSNIPQAIIYIFSHPFESIKLLFVNHLNDSTYDGIKLEFWYVFLLSGGLLLIRRPLYILLFLPLIGQKLYSDDYQMWGLNIFYSIEIVSILSIASFLIIIKFQRQKLALYSAIGLCFVTFLITVIKMNTRESKWYVSEKEKIYDPEFYKANHNIVEVNDALGLIPENASVCASEKLIPHLAFREKIYYFPYVNDANYVIFLLKSTTYPLKKEEYYQKVKEYEDTKKWEVIKKTEDIVLLKRQN